MQASANAVLLAGRPADGQCEVHHPSDICIGQRGDPTVRLVALLRQTVTKQQKY